MRLSNTASYLLIALEVFRQLRDTWNIDMHTDSWQLLRWWLRETLTYSSISSQCNCWVTCTFHGRNIHRGSFFETKCWISDAEVRTSADVNACMAVRQVSWCNFVRTVNQIARLLLCCFMLAWDIDLMIWCCCCSALEVHRGWHLSTAHRLRTVHFALTQLYVVITTVDDAVYTLYI